MATAAARVGSNQVNRPKRRHMRVGDTIHGSRVLKGDEAMVVRLDASVRFQARNLQRRLERATQRNEGFPERQSVAIAMLAVEEQIVKALWTIARQPLGRVAPINSGRCGLDYIHDRSDIHSIYADAAGGKWDTAAPRPSLPSAREISQADKVQAWLLYVEDEDLRKLLVIGATSKCGDAARRIPWVVLKVPQRLSVTSRTCQRRYDEALRVIADALTLARIA
jgi:hypothetical protein